VFPHHEKGSETKKHPLMRGESSKAKLPGRNPFWLIKNFVGIWRKGARMGHLGGQKIMTFRKTHILVV